MRGLSLVAASGGHSSSRCAGLSLSRPLSLRSTGSVIVAHGPSCSAACGIFPDQGSNPCPLHWQADPQPLRHQGSPGRWFLFIYLFRFFSLQVISPFKWSVSSWLNFGRLYISRNLSISSTLFNLLLIQLIIKKSKQGTSLVVQWLRICLPKQGTRVWSLVRKDPTCHGATKPVCHNCRACALEPMSNNYWAHVPQLLKPACLEPVLYNKRNHCNEKHVHHNEVWPPLEIGRASCRERV